ncbi:FIST signal transduction protein [Corallincola platygyrae]|uniref:FIST signal transduction protein n=1 Tax=Corallincola platygyrae TaxID=1193278 RepID=A0ABW4XQH7_9GAMM
MRIATAFSTQTETPAAVNECISQLESIFDTAADLLLIYPTSAMDADEIFHCLESHYPAAQLMLCTSCQGAMTEHGYHGVCGHGLVIWACHDPGGSFGCAVEPYADNAVEEAVQRVLHSAMAAAGRVGELPALVWLHGTPGQEERILSAIEQLFGRSMPVIGGSAADNDVAQKWLIGANGHLCENGVAVTLFYPSCELGFSFHSGYLPTTVTATVTQSSGRHLEQLDDAPAAELYNQLTHGVLGDELEKNGSILAATTLSPLGRYVGQVNGVAYYKLAHPEHVSEEGGLRLFAEVEEGEEVVLMQGTIESLIGRAGRVAQEAKETLDVSRHRIIGGLNIYCAGCMLTVQQQMPEVVDSINQVLQGAPFAGAFTFGEQGQFIGGEFAHGNLMIASVVFMEA